MAALSTRFLEALGGWLGESEPDCGYLESLSLDYLWSQVTALCEEALLSEKKIHDQAALTLVCVLEFRNVQLRNLEGKQQEAHWWLRESFQGNDVLPSKFLERGDFLPPRGEDCENEF